MVEHHRYMRIALDEAAVARAQGEVPVGAVVVIDGEIVGRAHNASLTRVDPTAHAEILAIRSAAGRVGNHRLVRSTLYCTVEPCLMCLGTALQARVSTLVYAARDPKVGALGRLEAMRWTARVQPSGRNGRRRPCRRGGVAASRFLPRAARGRERNGVRVGRGEVPKWP